MNILVLDCAFKPTVAIIKNGKLLAEDKVESENHSDNFMLLIDKTLKKSGLTINDIDEIMLNKGPGSFTGLRVAVSIAKGFGVDEKIKFSTFTSFDYVDGDEILVKGFSNFLYKKDKNNLLSCENMLELDKRKKYIVVNLELCEKLLSLGYKACFVEKKSYDEIYFNRAVKNLSISHLEPLYLRKSQAEMEREKKI